MESLILRFSIFLLAISLALSFLFIITSVKEKRYRPVGRILLLIPLLAVYSCLIFLPVPYHTLILSVILVAAITGALILYILPIGTNYSLFITGKQERVDERDAVFHRFYKLEPGTPEFQAYYEAHPENLEVDKKIRSLPELDGHGSRSYNRCTTPFMTASFDILETFSKQVDHWPEPKINGQTELSPEENTLRIKGFAKYLGAELVGITALNQAYVYSHIGRSPGTWGEKISLDHPSAIAVAVEMDFDMVRHAPHHIVTTETAFKYLEAGKIASVLARYIQLLGFKSRAHIDGNYRVMCVPIAADAGLGELGRLGLLITPKFGPRVRIAIVTTDIPLVYDKPVTFGVQDFCSFCKKCADNCPSASVDTGDKNVFRGAEKWITNQNTCYNFWRTQGSDCSVCVNVCPFSHPDTFLHNVVRWGIKRNKLFRRFALMADDFMYGRRPKNQAPFPSWHRPA